MKIGKFILFFVALLVSFPAPSDAQAGRSTAKSSGPGDASSCITWGDGSVSNSCGYEVQWWMSYPNSRQESVDRYSRVGPNATESVSISGVPNDGFWWACRTGSARCIGGFDEIRPSANVLSYSAAESLASRSKFTLRREFNAKIRREYDQRAAEADAMIAAQGDMHACVPSADGKSFYRRDDMSTCWVKSEPRPTKKTRPGAAAQ